MVPDGSYLEPITRLVGLWLELCRHALSRRVPGGFLSSLAGGHDWAILLDLEQRAQLEDEARKALGPNWTLKSLEMTLDLSSNGDETKLQLGQVLDELQSKLLEPGESYMGDAALLAFLLGPAGYRSQHLSLTESSITSLPHGEQWKLSR